MMELKKQIDQIFYRWDHADTPGGQVAVRHHGKLIYSRCFGLSNMEHRIPVTEDTCFHVASVSKQVTVLSMLLLVEEGKVSLDEDIRTYLPDLVSFKEPVTVRNLMNNNSGIRDQWGLLEMRGIRYTDTISMTDLLETLRPQKHLNFAPGSRYLYSNSNFTLIAEIVRRISGQDLPEFAKERIFEPLGMKHTFIRRGVWDTVHGISSSYSDNGFGTFELSPLNFALWGATSMNTTVWDLLTLLENYHNPTICTRATVEEMKKAPILSDGSVSPYAGGLFAGEHKGHAYIEHSGADAAFRAQVFSFEQDELDIAIVTNTANTPAGIAARKIADLVLGLPRDELPQPPANLTEPVAGRYFFTGAEGEGTMEIVQDGDGWAVKRRRGSVPLIADGQGGYQIGYLDEKVYFDANGLLTGIPGKPLTPMQRLEQASAQGREELLGKYYSDDLETVTRIYEQDGLLWGWHFRFGAGPLMAVEGDHYVYIQGGDTDLNLHFLRGEQGEPTGFSMECSRCLNMVCTKQ